MPRQSTTKKLSRSDLAAIQHTTTLPSDGVIVRYRGTEYGVMGVVGDDLVTWEGVWLNYRHCTILKSTLPHLPSPQNVVAVAVDPNRYGIAISDYHNECSLFDAARFLIGVPASSQSRINLIDGLAKEAYRSTRNYT